LQTTQSYIRDGIAIDSETGTVKEKAKYDYELIPAGTEAPFRLEVMAYERNEIETIENVIDIIIASLVYTEVRIGAKSRRGLGKIELSDCALLKLDLRNSAEVQQWIDFDWERSPFVAYEPQKMKHLSSRRSCRIEMDFYIPDTLLIRSYATDTRDPDSVMLMEGGTPVIPATSWTGAIRHALWRIGRETDHDREISNITRELFGFVDENQKRAAASRIIIESSLIEGSQSEVYTRNRIDRISGGVIEGALFDEAPIFKATVTFMCQIENPESYEIGAVLLALKEIGNGIQTIGGERHIGRGRLQGIEEPRITFLYGEPFHQTLAEYENALAAKITGASA
jgi:CRISPR/Cas system CSM-associated protein Csm3 (group 7 of RAMP superfamily)